MTKPKEILNTENSGLVISYFGNSVAVEMRNGQVFQCLLHRNQQLPVVGDTVLWSRQGDAAGTIDQVLPRRSELVRADKRGKTKAIAANIDVIIIVTSPPPIFSEFLIDRYLVAASLLNIPAILVVNKTDLLDTSQQITLDGALLPYQSIPYETLFTSVVNQAGMADLSRYLENKVGVLVGVSGVGKSSIIAALSEDDPRVGVVSSKGIGKHTTTATRLHHLRAGGALIDSPGVREFNLWPVAKEDLQAGFVEFKDYLTGCRFRNCSHGAEPDCAIKSALLSGKISPKRFESYQLLLKEYSKP
ncbi:MAG: ribosome small subunit-dependent GTPase A [Gammaproteobacteria bacterium]|nr:ribosome small subunit-dependent GTPase A [Gammaproteobacteria bacterium]